jgi:hypothetical protein
MRNITIINLNKQKEYIDLNELFYLKLGSTWVLDSMYLFMVGPFGLVGFFLNLISYFKIKNINPNRNAFNLTLKNYLKIYTMNSSMICFIFSLCAFFRSPRYFNLTQNYFGTVFNCKIIPWFTVTIFFYINILDCVLLTDRLATLTTKLKRFKNYEANKIGFLAFLTCFFINIPGYFLYQTKKTEEFEDIMNSYDKLIDFVYYTTDPFFFTPIGFCFMVILVTIKDIITMIVEISLSILVSVVFKRYLKHKAHLLNSNNNSNQRIEMSLKSSPTPVASTGKHEENKDDQNASLLLAKPNIVSQKSLQKNQQTSKIMDKLERTNEKIILMSIKISVCSILSHLGIIFCYGAYLYNDNSFFARYAVMFAILITILKYISNYFFFHKLV